MSKLDNLHKQGQEIDRRLRLETFPLAVKLLEKEEDIPEAAQRPLKDLGYRMNVCQGFAMSRRNGTTIAMLKEDMWCVEPVIGYGIEKPPKYFMEGRNRFPEDVRTLEAGSNYASDFPRLEAGKYIGVVSAPLTTADFVPDVVMIYCNTEQLGLLLLGRECEVGYSLKCGLSSHAACVFSIVPVMQNGNYHVAVPCRGDHYGAMAKDSEMVFTVATDKLEDLLLGLRYVEEHGNSKLPRAHLMQTEGFLPEPYLVLAKMLGMLTDK
jgi:uncharacterized protein (DUF169 family)